MDNPMGPPMPPWMQPDPNQGADLQSLYGPQAPLQFPQMEQMPQFDPSQLHPMERMALALHGALGGMPPVNPYANQGDQFGQSLLRGAVGGFIQPSLNRIQGQQQQLSAQQEAVKARNQANIAATLAARNQALTGTRELAVDAAKNRGPKSAIDPGYKIRGSEKGLNGAYSVGQVIPSNVAQDAGWIPKVYAPSTAGQAIGEDDVQGMAQGLLDGTLPPTAIQGRPTQYTIRILGALRKLDPKFSLTKASLDYTGLRQYYATLNQGQQVSLRQSAEKAGATLDYIAELNDQLTKAIPRSQFDAFNQGGLVWARQGMAGKKAADIATQMSGQIAGVTSELGRFYAGGSAPTDESNARAAKVINEKWAPNRIVAGIQSGKRDVNIGLLAVQEAGMISPSNPLQIGGGPQNNVNMGNANISVGGGQAFSPSGLPLTNPSTDMVRMTDPSGKPYQVHRRDVQAAVAHGWKEVQ